MTGRWRDESDARSIPTGGSTGVSRTIPGDGTGLVDGREERADNCSSSIGDSDLHIFSSSSLPSPSASLFPSVCSLPSTPTPPSIYSSTSIFRVLPPSASSPSSSVLPSVSPSASSSLLAETLPLLTSSLPPATRFSAWTLSTRSGPGGEGPGGESCRWRY